MFKEKLNEFKMFPNELVEQMYARLNVLIEDINALEISPLSTSDQGLRNRWEPVRFDRLPVKPARPGL